MSFFEQLAIIVPVGPGDQEWMRFMEEVCDAPLEVEILFVGTEDIDQKSRGEFERFSESRPGQVHWLKAPVGRGAQMNAGASFTKRKILWFLHADSRLPEEIFLKLKDAFEKNPTDLHFFRLRFLLDGPALMKINEWGAWIRSRLMQMPFGDQGYCLSKQIFDRMGGYEESRLYGEDHALVWKLRQQGYRVRPNASVIWTSARKYQEKGWFKTTFRYLFLTYWQAWPEWFKWRILPREEIK